ncbi:hypothetical protein HNR01_001802 [Methylorubrum rhodesianum]|uniref:hypothetical protein n=1 Tax=Methylorubrum rhodesianum TaxID=29427 RepID=UPI00160C9919|nr:hypothetical protein [Methylorubrum rhodesianum]MBB5762182.1 hypothetical protein [Methylorubrum rhodesianum]
MPKLTERQVALLREAEKHVISETGNDYYRVGGYGMAPIRYDYRSFRKLRDMGLVAHKDGGWRATDAGRAALGEPTAPR